MPADAHTYDVLVIGGGPAGSSAATRTALAGLRTMVIEKEAFPRFRIGESLLPQGNELLRETGVWPKIEAAGFLDKFGARFLLADGSRERLLNFAEGLVPGLERTYQVERARFDQILLDHARETGAEVRMGVTVNRVEPDADGHRVSLQTSEGSHEIRARWVIDAGGREALYPSVFKQNLEPSGTPKRVAIYNHFLNVARTPGRAGGDTGVVRLPDGWFWVIPIDAERTSIGLVTTVQALREAKLAPADHFARTVAAAAKLREIMAHATPTEAFRVTSDYSYFRRELARDRLVLAGDAGGFTDPIFSSGVYMACLSAKLAAELVIRTHRAGRGLRPAECRRYTRAVKRHARVFQRMIEAFYDNASFSVFMCERPPLGLLSALTSIAAGCSRLSWPIWWRFHFFLLVCRLQRHLPLVPDLPVAGHPAPPSADLNHA